MKPSKAWDGVADNFNIATISENPSYPWILVDHEIISPSELCAMSDDELRARWGHYIRPNLDGVFERLWSCRSYTRAALNSDTRLCILIPSPFPTPMS
jgi:hypothetical protein